ncbi:MAG: hypothetical protein EKK33_11820 [Bradyrhizobiaceae bacterium]|jgi:hypothetical protein|nr:MAG: hypothetical protein EKK33_11820 [Bradyrhizobiaceae bacterium]
MIMLRLALVGVIGVVVGLAEPAIAQGVQGIQGLQPSAQTGRAHQQPQGGYSGPRSAVATQPSNNPFANPIGQGVPPAVSADSRLNSSRTTAPR